MHVASVCFKCFKVFIGILQLFHADVTKVDRDGPYVAMVVHVCCKLLFPMFHLCFLDACCNYVYLDVAYVPHICCMCFIRMLRMVAMVFKRVSGVFFKCFISMFQVFQLPSDVCCNHCIWIFQK